MKYKFNNPITNTVESFSTKEEAEVSLSVVKEEYIKQEDHRFQVAKEIIEGNNTTWMSADLVNDPEDYTYQVFNHTTGLHEPVSSLTLAKQRTQELKDSFLNEVFLNAIVEYEEESISVIPSTTV